jgi:hypothetical protein
MTFAHAPCCADRTVVAFSYQMHWRQSSEGTHGWADGGSSRLRIGADDFRDEDVLCLYLTLRDRMKAPYDDSNPQVVCYFKLSTPFHEARWHTEDKPRS